MSREDSFYLKYAVALLAEFARRFDMKDCQAYRYLKLHGGLDYLREYYDVLHTLTFDDVVESVAHFCQKSGGKLV